MCLRSIGRALSRRWPVGLCVVLLLGSAAACTGEASREPGGQTWSTGEALAAQGLVWGSGHVVHLGDGTEIDTEHDFDDYAVAGDSVWFTRADAQDIEPGEDYTEAGRLWRATRDGVEKTDAIVTDFLGTADGRYLVYLDDANGPKDDSGTAAHLLVVIDTETGKETIRTSEGMDESGVVGLDEAYEDGAPHLVAVTDETAYVQAIGDHHSFDLATGDVASIDEGDVPGNRDEATTPLWNPAHTWRIDRGADELRPVFASKDDQVVTPEVDAPEWSLLRWLDDDTALGLAQWRTGVSDEELSMEPTDRNTVMTCEVPSGTCTLIPEATQTLPSGAQPLPRRGLEGQS